VIGVGQVVAHSSDPHETEPIHLWAEASSLAISDAGARRGIAGLGGLSVVHCDSWSYDMPVARLARRLRVAPRLLVDSRAGGNQPQYLLHSMGDAIARGQLDLGLVVSGEALHTADVLTREKQPLPWSNPASPHPKARLGDYFSEAEVRHGMLPIMRSFALRDTARRANLGVAVEDYAREPASTYAAMSEVAAANPYAWHGLTRSPEDILLVCPSNRMPVRPYTKLMMASPKVNQAAAVLIASNAEADAIGVPADRRVYLRGWSSANDFPYVAENEDLWRSRAMADSRR
jgi:acetyl-CoA C-acetyltransferase